LARFPRRETAQKSRVRTALIAGTKIEAVWTVRNALNAAQKSRTVRTAFNGTEIEGVQTAFNAGTFFKILR